MRPELGPRRTIFDAHRLEHADVAAFGGLLLDASLVEGVDEGSSAAVENRNLRAFHFDHHIVDAKPEQGGHQMLDRRDMAGRRIAEHRAQIGRADLRDSALISPPSAPPHWKTTPASESAGLKWTVTG